MITILYLNTKYNNYNYLSFKLLKGTIKYATNNLTKCDRSVTLLNF